jgi:hypothetical protein
MAVWQFDTYLVPGDKVRSSTGEVVERVSEHDFESLSWWEGNFLPPDYTQVLSSVLPRHAHWSREVEFWGQEDSDCVSVARRGNAVEEVRVRFDVRNVNVSFVDHMANTARRWACVFLDEDFEVVPASTAALLKHIRDSSAHRYLLDPRSFLAEGGELP